MKENSYNEIASYQSLLREIADICESASLTGVFAGGAGRVLQRYNAILEKLVSSGALPPGLFLSLPEGADFGDIGVEARMLSGYLRKEKKNLHGNGDPSVLIRLAPFVGKEDLALLIREQREQGTPLDMDTITHLAPFLNSEDLGQLIRGHLNTPSAPPQPPAPSPAPSPAPTPSPAPNPAPQPETTMRFPEAPAAPRNPEDRLAVLLERLKDPRLTDQERSDLIDRVRSLTTG
jgi:hypothetical protein